MLAAILLLLLGQGFLYYREQQQSMGLLSSASGRDSGTTVGQFYKAYEAYDGRSEDDIQVDRLNALYNSYHESVAEIYQGVPGIAEQYEEYRNNMDPELVKTFDALLEEDVYFGDAPKYVMPGKIAELKFQREESIRLYQTKVEQVLENAARMQQISIFNKNGGFSQQNIQKTAEDYKLLQQVDRKDEANYGVTSVFSFRYCVYFSLIAAVLAALFLAEENKRGLLSLLHLSPGGRGKFAVRQTGVLLGMNVAINIIFLGALVLQALVTFGHAEAWLTPIQHMEETAFLPLLWDKWQLLLYVAVFQTTGTFVVSYLLLTLITSFRNGTLAWMAAGFLFLVEYIPYTLLRRESMWAVIKHMNLFSMLQPTEVATTYYNCGIVGGICSRQELVLAAGAIFSAVLALVYCALLPGRKPVETEGGALRFAEWFDEKRNQLVEWLPMLGKEMYKLLIAQKGLLVVLLLGALVWNNRSQGELQIDNFYLKEMYEQFDGEVADEQFDAYVEKYVQKEAEIYRKVEELKLQFETGEISASEYSVVYGLLANVEPLSRFVSEMEIKQEQYRQLRERGITPYVLNDSAYNHILGTAFFERENNYAFCALLFIVILSIVVFSQEKAAHMIPILRASAGRERIYRRKMLLLCVMTILAWVGITACSVKNVMEQFALQNGNAPIQSVAYMLNFPVEMSIRSFFVCFHLRRLVLLLAFTIGVSVLGETATQRVALPAGMLLFVPHLIYLCGVKAAMRASVVIPVGGTQWYSLWGSKWWIADLVYVVIGVSAWLIRMAWRRKWN